MKRILVSMAAIILILAAVSLVFDYRYRASVKLTVIENLGCSSTFVGHAGIDTFLAVKVKKVDGAIFVIGLNKKFAKIGIKTGDQLKMVTLLPPYITRMQNRAVFINGRFKGIDSNF